MKYISLSTVTLLMGIVFFNSCSKEEYSLGDQPGSIELIVTQRADTSNYVTFSSTAEGFIYNWEFGNGSSGQGKTVEYAYPIRGEYTVKLTVNTAGGFASDSITLLVDGDLPINSPIPDLLTGGIDNINGKTWVIDSTTLGHLGCGPIEGTTDSWWQAPALDKTGVGYYNDEFTFILDQYSFIQETKGDAFILSAGEVANFPDGEQLVPGYRAFYTAPNNLTWTFTRENGNNYLTINSGGFIGCYTGVSFTYQIMSISDNEMTIRNFEPSNSTIAWYQRLIVKE